MKTKSELIAIVKGMDVDWERRYYKCYKNLHLVYIDPIDGTTLNSEWETRVDYNILLLLHNWLTGDMRIADMIQQIELQYDIVVDNIMKHFKEKERKA